MNKRFNIRPDDCDYIVKEDERKVICILNDTSNVFIDFCINNLSLPLEGLWGNEKALAKLFNELHMPKRFTGIATCFPTDEWNTETGKTIAFSHMKDKLNKSFFKRANLLVNTYDKWLDDAEAMLNELGYKLSVNTERRHEYIKSLLGVEDSDGEQEDN